MESSFTYKAPARAIQDRAYYREEVAPTQQLVNIAVDPRIYRGSTFSKSSKYTEKIEKIPSYPKKAKSRKVVEEEATHKDGFSDAYAQTDEFDGNVVIEKKESDAEVQTDPYTEKPIIHRKPPPLRAVGTKTSTPGTDLFDFNVEVKPFVETLVQKALAQASMEVHEEEELANMQRYLKAFSQNHRVEEAAIAKIEAAEREKYEEKERVVQERLKIEAAQLEARSKILARGFAEFFTWDIANDAIEELKRRNYFYDEIEREIDAQYMPWLEQSTNELFSAPSALNSLKEKVHETVKETIEKAEQEMEIQFSVTTEQQQMNKEMILRMMMAEDKVSFAMRQKKKIKKKSKKPKKNEEEDDAEPNEDKQNDETPTESTYDEA